MRKENFKLLIENFNKFIMKEGLGYSQKSVDLINSVPDEFKDYVNTGVGWYCAEDWISGIEFNDDKEKQEKINFYKGIARKLGCTYEDLLIALTDDIYEYSNANPNIFMSSYSQQYNYFDLNNKKLKGYKDIMVTVVAPVCSTNVKRYRFDSGPASN